MIWSEAATLLGVFFIAVITPGADFACVVRESVMYGRRAGTLAALGVGSALLVHVAYTVLGLGLLISQSVLAFTIIKWAGAAYLVYLGIQSLRPGAASAVEMESARLPVARSARRSFAFGFLTNLLNPKAALFFVSLFTVIVSHTTPVEAKIGYGLMLAFVAGAWFALVAFFFTTPRVRSAFARLGRWINRVTGIVFIGLGVRLALQRVVP